jgi:uncharacterized protein YggU (UPF0235/DUF167 family)
MPVAPVDGKANAALIVLLPKMLGITRRDVLLLRGEASRAKHVEVRGVDGSAIRALVI